MKKNRGNKLYLDYVQHREGKTIVAPYSARGNAKGLGLIATPLHWAEVDEQLRPANFTISKVIERLNHLGDPFKHFREVGEQQAFKAVLSQINGS